MREMENFIIGLNELRSNKLKTLLTMLGIVFGVASVIAMLSIGEGARQESLEQIELLGTNNIIVKKKLVSEKKSKKASFSPGLSLKDANSIKEINPFVEAVTPQREIEIECTYKSSKKTIKIIGTTDNYFSTFNTSFAAGGRFKQQHLDNYSNVCVIGPDVKRELFKYENPIGKQLKIGMDWFTVLGVTASKNSGSSNISEIGNRNFNLEIYIPITTLNNKLNTNSTSDPLAALGIFISMDDDEMANVLDKYSINQLTVKVVDDTKIKQAADLVKNILLRRHYNIEDFEVIIPEEIIEQKQKTQRIFNIVMGAIAGISLLVGGIGIMNIMLANILERTKEIGIRRAIGARRKDVLNQFIYEALVISILGGLSGIILGVVLTSVITTYAEWRTIITPFSVVLAFFVSVAVGLGFGSYPAKKAAEKDPIESLRYE